ncbi:flagellar protein [Halalkalibacillus sediminis]|uniref:Flagellar protein n=1 Tax=Halalkalibacillus sediminis TaxID=2018042 RepID=A0A2I0QWC9_9BACI|nr:TIGR02530 family flagellar biosynthesis protein [Halalkalibacillus sediminis]PKR78625.1 flagellar protein [Halalkalibacillus sediminis]
MSPKINPIHHQQIPLKPNPTKTKQAPKQSFQSLLEQSAQELKVSKHAQKRLDERNIHIDQKQWNMIQEKMVEAKNKGVSDSAIIMKDAVLVASTKNNTIITAMDRQEAADQLVTNINGTIILQDDK